MGCYVATPNEAGRKVDGRLGAGSNMSYFTGSKPDLVRFLILAEIYLQLLTHENTAFPICSRDRRRFAGFGLQPVAPPRLLAVAGSGTFRKPSLANDRASSWRPHSWRLRRPTATECVLYGR